MNIKELKKQLGGGARVRRDGDEVEVRFGRGRDSATFRITRNSGWSEAHLASYLRSKIPALTVGPKV